MKTAENINHEAGVTTDSHIFTPSLVSKPCRELGEPCVFGSNRCRKCGRHREPSSAALMVRV